MECVDESLVRYWCETLLYTYFEISRECNRVWPGHKGFSERSVRRYCKEHSISKKSNLINIELNRLVRSSVSKVGRSYGRNMMTGLLHSQGWRVGENRVAKALKEAHPSYHQSRKTESYRLMNPLPYIAHYFGHKIHVDQNEKLVMFGATHILAVNGYSGMIISLVTMPIKNCSLIYEHVFLEALRTYGLWQQVRVDHGTEWAILLFVQKHLSADNQGNSAILPYVQSSSRQNHTVERMWVEINTRINYPIKHALIQMMENHEIDVENPHHKFCVSWVSIRIANVGAKLFVQSWNNHPLPRKINCSRGVPVIRMRNSRIRTVDEPLIPSPSEALQLYRSAGGTITDSHEFGIDPLSSPKQLMRQKAFNDSFRLDDVFHTLVNRDDTGFKRAVLFFIDITSFITLIFSCISFVYID